MWQDKMNDSSDDDDLETLRQEALKSLKRKTVFDPVSASINPSTSKNGTLNLQQHEQSAFQHRSNEDDHQDSTAHQKRSSRSSSKESRNNSQILSKERNKFTNERQDNSGKTDFRQENLSGKFASSGFHSKNQYRNHKPFSNSDPFCTEHGTSERNSDSTFKSSHKVGDRRSAYSRRSRTSAYSNRNEQNYNRKRRSSTPERFRRSSPRSRSSKGSPKKFGSRHYDRKSISPFSQRRYHSSYRSRNPRNDSSSSRKGASQSSLLNNDSLSNNEPIKSQALTLPLCSPKHYVELFYGKKLQDTKDSKESNSCLLTDEDRALLASKSALENRTEINCQVSKNDSTSSHSKRNYNSPGQHKSVSDGETSPFYRRLHVSSVSSHELKMHDEPPVRKRIASPNSSKAKPWSSDKRSKQSHVRDHCDSVPDEHCDNIEHVHQDSLNVDSQNSSSKERNQMHETSYKSRKLIRDKPIDPILEARRKKFENNSTVRFIPRKIKLSSQSAKLDPSTNKDDLRNVLIAKHRQLHALEVFEDHFDSKGLDESCPPEDDSSMQPIEDVFEADDSVPNFILSSEIPNFESCDEQSTSFAQNCSVPIKVEHDLQDLNLNVLPEMEKSISLDGFNSELNNLEDKSNDFQQPCISENIVNPKLKCEPDFQLSDPISNPVIKEEPLFIEANENTLEEEQPVIDEPDLIPQQPDKPEDTFSASSLIKIKPLTELLDKKVLKKVKKIKKKEEKESKKRKKKSKSKDKEKHREKKLTPVKRKRRLVSEGTAWTNFVSSRIVRTAFEEALGQNKRKVFDKDEEMVPVTPEKCVNADSRKILVLDKLPKESSPPITDSVELESESSLEENVINKEKKCVAFPNTPVLQFSSKNKKGLSHYIRIQQHQV